MKYIILLLAIVGSTACRQPETSSPESDISSVEELTADSARLKELRQQCKTDRANLGGVLCDRVAEATRKRFHGDGTVPYTPSDTQPKF